VAGKEGGSQEKEAVVWLTAQRLDGGLSILAVHAAIKLGSEAETQEFGNHHPPSSWHPCAAAAAHLKRRKRSPLPATLARREEFSATHNQMVSLVLAVPKKG
jgi:hypothetical protein